MGIAVLVMAFSGCVAYAAHYTPKVLTNHIPHLLLPKHLADRFQQWAENS